MRRGGRRDEAPPLPRPLACVPSIAAQGQRGVGRFRNAAAAAPRLEPVQVGRDRAALESRGRRGLGVGGNQGPFCPSAA
jgi:hypothetical protein